MKKVKVLIEEHLCKEIEVEISDLTSTDEIYSEVLSKVKEGYYSGDYILTADDFNGVTQILINPNLNNQWEEI